MVKEQRLFVFEDTVRGFSGQYKGQISDSLGNISATRFFLLNLLVAAVMVVQSLPAMMPLLQTQHLTITQNEIRTA